MSDGDDATQAVTSTRRRVEPESNPRVERFGKAAKAGRISGGARRAVAPTPGLVRSYIKTELPGQLRYQV